MAEIGFRVDSVGDKPLPMTNPAQSSSPVRSVVVATHGHCFDGLCSAVMFTRLLRHVMPNESLQFAYHAAGYGPGQNGVDPNLLGGDVNAILDFRFTWTPRLTWYFDHHVSAFVSLADRSAYDAAVRESGAGKARDRDRRMFHDGTYGSCTKLIADVGAQRFDLDPAPTAELVRWADLIDTASFPSAEMAVARKEPELQLMTVIEYSGNDAFLAKTVPRLLTEPLAEVARAPDIQAAYTPLLRTHESLIEQVKLHAEEKGPVVYVDLSSETIEVAGKFVTYALFPKSAYSVVVTRSKSKCKISVGYNPWSGVPRTHNIAELCERYGGGGHPVVGAISVSADDVEGARRIGLEITSALAA
jgi:hypothetical protein